MSNFKDFHEEQKFRGFVAAVKQDIEQMVALGDLDPNPLDVLEYLDMEYRADTPEHIFDNLCKETTAWLKK